MQTFLFAGASSAIAQCTAKILQDKGHKVIGISTKPNTYNYNEFSIHISFIEFNIVFT
jgi:NADP-dependent 3-hydroxy acid dehydrogenase YdfG